MVKISELIKELSPNNDVTIITNNLPYTFIYQNDLFDIRLFNRDYLKMIKENENTKLSQVFVGVCKDVAEETKEKIYELLFSGMMIIYDKYHHLYYMFDLIAKPSRSVSDSISEPDAIAGSRDGFVETLKVNIALIRNRVKDPKLHIDEEVVGRISKTRVNILSIDGLTNKSFINNVKRVIEKIDVDGVFSMEDITSYFQKDSIMPKYLYLGSPDLVARHLCDGEILIVIDGIPNVICIPISIVSFFRLRVDQVNLKAYSIVLRFFVILAFFLSTVFLGLLMSFITYQSDSLSLLVLSTLKVTQKGVFLPIYMEIFIVLFLFELYYIVSFKSPKLTLSSMVVLVGGIIIGQNTVQAGMVGVFIITLVALSFLSSFTISSNITFVMSLSYIRLILLIGSLLLGIFGLTLVGFCLLVKISSENKFCISYNSPIIPFSLKGIRKSFMFESNKNLVTRPDYLDVKNKRKKR